MLSRARFFERHDQIMTDFNNKSDRTSSIGEVSLDRHFVGAPRASMATWQSVMAEIMERIRNRTYTPGELIPTEQRLAVEFGCARATVNRALTELARRGIVERRRKVGTRVNASMEDASTIGVPIIRDVIAERGQTFDSRRVVVKTVTAPPAVQAAMMLSPTDTVVFTREVIFADGKPWCSESRWTLQPAYPDTGVDSINTSLNEWLCNHVAIHRWESEITAERAGDVDAADDLDVIPDTPVLVRHSCCWSEGRPVTYVCHAFQVGHSIRSFPPGSNIRNV